MLHKMPMNQLSEIPIVKQALFLLQEAGSANGIKITETGALGRNFVQALWDKHIKTSEDDLIFRPTRELECPEATRIHFLLTEFKYVRKFKGKVVLTENGKRALEKPNLEKLYFDLITAGINRWHWGYEDRYPDFDFLQSSAEQLIHTLLESSSKTVTLEEIFDKVFSQKTKAIDPKFKEELQRCLTVRFFYRFCIPFGILLAEEGDRFMNKKPDEPFKKTEFFMASFKNIIYANSKLSAEVEKKKLKENIGFTPSAQKFWNMIEPKMRIQLLNNVYCFSCEGETGIGNFSGSIDRGDLLLKGVCTKCGKPVARLIECE